VNAVRFVRVVDVSQRIIDGHGFDFVLFPDRRTTESAEAPDEGRSRTPRGGGEAVLPEIAVTWAGLRCHDREHCAIALAPIECDPHRRARFPLLASQDRDAAEILEPAVGPVDPEDPELSREPLGRDRDIDGLGTEAKSVFDIHVVRPIDSGNRLSQVAVETMDDDRTRRRSDLHGADNHALRRVGRMNPDGGVIRVVRQRRGSVGRLDLDGGRQRLGRRHLRLRIFVDSSAGPAARRRNHEHRRERGGETPGQKFTLNMNCICRAVPVP
jgi:hypothetical protein